MTKAQSSTRRSMFVGAAALAALPLAASAAAASPDAALIRDAERAMRLKSEINVKAFAEGWDNATLDAHCDELNALIEAVCETPAFSQEGLKAKGRLLAVDTARTEPPTDQVEILLASLLRDLIGAAAQVPAFG